MSSSEVPAHGPRIDEAATKEAGGLVLPQGNGIRVGGWEIRTAKGPIDGERATAAFRSALVVDGDDRDDDDDDDKTKRRVPALPEQLYGSSLVEATHVATGIKISFTALGALRSWMRADRQREQEEREKKKKKVEGGGGGGGGGGGEATTTSSSMSTSTATATFPPPPPPPPKVPAAEKWRAARAREIAEHGAPELVYDWTFTCPYGGDVVVVSERKEEEDEEEEEEEKKEGSAGDGGNGDGNAGGEKVKNKKPETVWKATPDRLDRAALSARDPLLLWDEVLLLASELDDCGHAEVSVRVRAMPGRWFALLRCFVRVDGVLVRLYETRVVATFGRGEGGGGGGGEAVVDVLRETRHSEGEFAELAAAGAPGATTAAATATAAAAAGGGGVGFGGTASAAAASSSSGGAYADADSAAAALSAVAPIGVTRFLTERLFVV